MIQQLIQGDCQHVLRSRDQVGPAFLVFGSPPYEDARQYHCDFKLKGQAWVNWMVQVFETCLGVCPGMTAFVVQGRTRKFSWSGTPALLQADLIRKGVTLREPLFYHRIGIPGSGGPDDFRHDIEYIIRATHGGKLPYSNNLAMGKPPKYAPGGAPSHRKANGDRVNKGVSGSRIDESARKVQSVPPGINRGSTGQPETLNTDKPRRITRRDAMGIRSTGIYKPPKIANPGNVIECGSVGKGHMGTLPGADLAHENHAPFPEYVAEWMIRSYTRPGDTVLDPFCGSGTTLAVAKALGRGYIGIDVDPEMIELSQKRLGMITEGMML